MTKLVLKYIDDKDKIVIADDNTIKYEEEEIKEVSNIKEALRWLREKKKKEKN